MTVPFLAIILLLLTLGSTAAARNIFVNNVSGSDAAQGSMPQSVNPENGPVQTLERALRIAEPCDRIVLIPTGRPYRTSVSLAGKNCSGTEDAPFTILGNGATLDGTQPVPANAWEHYKEDVFRFQPPRVGFQCLYHDGKPVPRADMTGNVLPKLDPGQWCLFGPHIYFRVEKDRLPAEYDLSYGRYSTGITLLYVQNVVIQDVTVQGFRLDGISAINNAHNVRLLRVTARGNGRAGVSIGNVSEVEIKDSLIGENHTAQVLTLPYSKTRVVNTQIVATTAPAFDRRGGELNVEGGEVIEAKVSE
jgi:hypothetical protein